MMIVLGVDPGTAITGYGIIQELNDATLKVIAFGAIKTQSNLSDWNRLQILFQKIQELIILHHPDSGAVEKLFFQQNVTTAISVGQARGVILLAMAQKGLSVGEYTPLEVKQAVVGYGKAEKYQMQRMVTILLGLPEVPSPDDVADALAIAICHINSQRFKELTSP
jgi:crossover junction endodeoxyribonuclease RuvC